VLVAGLIAAGLAAAVHVYIFYLETFAWTRPSTRSTFGTSEEEALTTRPLAFNQGFYNLFLAIGTVIGIVIIATTSEPVGSGLVLLATGSMLAAAIVLAGSDRTKARAAAVQGVFPLIAVVLLLIHLAG
jgi:putative membrane protein